MFIILFLAAVSIMASSIVSADRPLYKVVPGARFCVDRQYTLLKVPVEFVGLDALQTKMGDKRGITQKLRLLKPARIYGIFNWGRILEAGNWGHIPDKWTLYRQAVPDLIKGMNSDIYYIDLPAGENILKINSSWVCLGIKPLDELLPIEKLYVKFTPAAPGGIFAPGSRISGRLNVPTAWEIKDVKGRVVASGNSRAVNGPATEAGLYFLRLKLSAGREFRNLLFPLYIKAADQARVPSVKNRIPISLDIRGIVDYWRYPQVTLPVFYSIAQTMVKYGANLAYANLTAEELNVFREFGISVIMDIRRDVDAQVSNHPALFGWFDSKVINKQDIAISLKRYQEQQARAEIKNSLLLYKPMSFVASWLGTGGQRDPMLLWQKLSPAIRTLRCTPFNGALNALYSSNNNGADYSSIFAITERCEKTPWYMMFSAYGKRDVKNKFKFFGRRIPNAAEIKAIIHLALANGAKGIFIYRAVQDDSLISPFSGTPRTKSIQGLAEVADFLNKNSDFLKKSTPVNIRTFCANLAVKLIPRRVKGKIYIYAVNLNSEQTVKTHIIVWPKRGSSENITLKLSLSPGGAKLLPVRH
ncbi:MAG: hypothetical protein L3J71_13495 [Victivallaceae bacterium]|nr:hypothetical protein [Victivallaceae bacterium]